jgi:hypothetical protein
MRAIVVGAIAPLMLFGACGGAPEPSAEALCERIAEDRSNDTGAGQIPGSSDEWKAWVDSWEEMSELAPPEVKDALETIAASVAKVAETADGGEDYDKLFEDPAYEPAQEEFSAWESDNCDSGGYYPG